MNKNKFGKNSFTLSETLITIVILGIIAVVVVPSIINNYQKRLTITKLKKAYATLEVAAANIAGNTGCLGKDIGCTGLLEQYTNNYSSDLTQKFFELSGMKVDKKYIGGGEYKALNYDSMSESGKINARRHPYYIFTDKNNIGYSITNGTLRLDSDTIQKALFVMVYTNPDFSSNKASFVDNSGNSFDKDIFKNIKEGYNVFSFVIYDNFIVEPTTGCFGGAKYPLSKNSDANSGCNKNGTLNCYGNSCAAKIIKDGWKITYY